MNEHDKLLMSLAAALTRLQAIKAICESDGPGKEGACEAISAIIAEPLLIPVLKGDDHA